MRAIATLSALQEQYGQQIEIYHPQFPTRETEEVYSGCYTYLLLQDKVLFYLWSGRGYYNLQDSFDFTPTGQSSLLPDVFNSAWPVCAPLLSQANYSKYTFIPGPFQGITIELCLQVKSYDLSCNILVNISIRSKCLSTER